MIHQIHRLTRFIIVAVALTAVVACSSSRPYTLGPVKTFDPDNKDIPPPAETEEHFRWESFYLSTFHQLEKVLDLGWTARKIGIIFGLDAYERAENVNALDEVPNSSWYTRRHYFNPMSREALRRGPVKTDGPDTSQTLTVISGKSEGVTPGFTVRDADGERYIIKLDNPDNPEYASSSEVISTNIYYAAGYYVPQNSISYFDPARLVIASDATVTREGKKQPMTQDDLEGILRQAYTREDGKVRVLASKYVEGRPMGPWHFRGTREGDPNDRIPHQDRRELRGLRVLASWINDTDRRTANTMAVYVDENGKNYIRHYLLDMGSTLGTNGLTMRHLKRGLEYRYDPRYMALLYASLGIYVKPWSLPEAKERPYYPSVGYFESKLFDPGSWVTDYPNPAFEELTPRDGFWGAKLVMAFSDDDVRALVESGRLSNPEAEQYLIQVLKERRDEIGRYWFGRLNPLDKFTARRSGNTIRLGFADLGVDGNLFTAGQTSYRYSVRIVGSGHTLIRGRESGRAVLPIDISSVPESRQTAGEPPVLRVRIHTLRQGQVQPEKHTDVYIALEGEHARVVGLQREV